MRDHPRLSLCIPTSNHAEFLEGALLSGLREAATQPPGTVEVLVCDNASDDGTADLIVRLQSEYPELRCHTNEGNLGFDRNYLLCLEHARGDFAWILGDDDVWMPGCVARVLAELDGGADACLCQAEACDDELKPLLVLPWFLDPNPPRRWRLEREEDLIAYFGACARNAAVFAFISVAIVDRQRLLVHRGSMERAVGLGYIHLWGMMEFLRSPAKLHYIPDVLIRNRMSDARAGSLASRDLFARLMHDLQAWTCIADTVFRDDPELASAFFHVLGRNHHNTILPGMREHAHSEAEWASAEPYLLRAGFSGIQLAAVDLAFHHLKGRRLPMRLLDPLRLCIADLPLLARAARNIAILALGNSPDPAPLLDALLAGSRAGRIRVYCPAGHAGLPTSLETLLVDLDAYGESPSYRDTMLNGIAAMAPDMVVNLDVSRLTPGEDLVAAARPAGCLAFDLPGDTERAEAWAGRYNRMIAPGDGIDGILAALGLREQTVAQ